MKAVEPQRNTGGRFVMTADPAILKRIRGCLDFPPWSGGVRSERHAAVRMVIRSMLARASAGVR
jgi:hypothetical protein